MSSDMKLKPVVKSSQVVYSDAYSCISHVTADFGEFAKDYFVNDRGIRSAVVVARGEEVLLTRQYRFLIDRLSWEIPGGRVDPGETPRQAALRECAEETGFRCNNLALMLFFQPGLDALLNPTYIFYSAQGEQLERQARADEVVECAWLPLSRCLEMIFAGEILDALSIIGLLAYRTRMDSR